MEYCSTRNREVRVSAAWAISHGISEEGGLFVPCSFPQVSAEVLGKMTEEDYRGRAKRILSLFLTDFSSEEIGHCVEEAYTAEKFGDDFIAPISMLDEKTGVLELWHGPTCAFKDMALQILPHLLTVSAGKVSSGKTVVILVATSGDTGKAALEGFKDVPNTRILVFYPEDGVSAVQKKQMNTQKGENVAVCAIRGNFDDAQTGVKRIFTSEQIKKTLEDNNMQFSSANSINWGRLLPQIVYYFSAYCDLVKEGTVKLGEEINVVVPTGNFGNILAAYYAKKMGLPVKKFICASNTNNVLTDFIRTGTYDKNRAFHTTVSPSMDILISSNLERLLYDMSGCDDQKIAGWMQELKDKGVYTVDEGVKAQLQSLFCGGFATDEETKAAIGKLYHEENYLCDTHTAVAIHVYQDYKKTTGDETPTVIASTASPFKFADAVLEGVTGEVSDADGFTMIDRLAELTKEEIPAPIAALKTAESRFFDVCDKDEASMTLEVTRLLQVSGN